GGGGVPNRGLGKANGELVFPTTAWNQAFQFAADNGLILVATAGNGGKDLPGDDNLRPATRTPGTITVGALDTDDTARGDSNYGSSVDIWAPGTKLPVAPTPGSPRGSLATGTSVAAPFVSGVVAMIRAVNPFLNT